MKVLTQMGLLDINPESVVAIRKAHVMPETVEFCDLTHYVEFDDRFYSTGDNVACISEDDAEKLAELAGVEVEEEKEKSRQEYPQASAPETNSRKTVFVPFEKQLVLNEWEKHFDENIAWKQGRSQEPGKGPKQVSSSPFSDGTIEEEENRQSESLIEEAFQE